MTVDYSYAAPHVALITLNRPHALNALDFNAMDAFSRAVEQAHADPELRALVVTGAGERAFCSGGDLKELASCTTEADGRRLSAGMTGALQRLEDLPVPTLAAVNGLARGGGAEIAIACDLRWMASSASMGFTQIGLAITPGWGGGQRLFRTSGYARAMEWLLEGSILPAESALAAGLVSRVLPQESLLPAAIEWAAAITNKPQQAVRAVKQLLRAGQNDSKGQAAAFEHDVFPTLWASEEHHTAVAAFLNRPRN